MILEILPKGWEQDDYNKKAPTESSLPGKLSFVALSLPSSLLTNLSSLGSQQPGVTSNEISKRVGIQITTAKKKKRGPSIYSVRPFPLPFVSLTPSLTFFLLSLVSTQYVERCLPSPFLIPLIPPLVRPRNWRIRKLMESGRGGRRGASSRRRVCSGIMKLGEESAKGMRKGVR